MRRRWLPRFPFKVLGMLLLLASLNAHAQVPGYFEQHQMWSIFQSASCGNVECYCVSESALYVDQDTTFGQRTYKRLGIRGIQYEGAIGEPDPMNPCNTQSQQFDHTQAFLRQSNDSVFMFDTDLQTEVLYVSYNLQVGDALDPSSWVDVVDSLDTVIINGDAHRRFMYSGPGGSGVLIEGVVDMGAYGSVPLGGAFGGVFGANEVGCFAENGSTVWTNPNGSIGGCDYFLPLGVEDLRRKMFNVAIHPNPASDVLNITVAEPMQYVVTLRDLTGKDLLHELNAERIQVGCLSAGAYLVEVCGLDGQPVFRDKVIIAR